jgi:hypothetical protein
MSITLNPATGGITLRVNQGGPGTLTPDGVQTLTNKTLVSPVIQGGLQEATHVANSGSAFTVSLTNGSVQVITLTANCTYTFPTPEAGRSFTLIQKQDATGSRTATFPASVKMPGGTAFVPTATASKADLLTFTADADAWYCTVAGKDY